MVVYTMHIVPSSMECSSMLDKVCFSMLVQLKSCALEFTLINSVLVLTPVINAVAVLTESGTNVLVEYV